MPWSKAALFFLYFVSIFQRASGRESTPEICKLYKLNDCPDTNWTIGFIPELGNISLQEVSFESDVKSLRHIHSLDKERCREFLVNIFWAVQDTASKLLSKTQEFVFDPLSLDVLDEADHTSLRIIRKYVQDSETDLRDVHADASDILLDISSAPDDHIIQNVHYFLQSLQEPQHDGQCTALGTAADSFKPSLLPHSTLFQRWDTIVSTLVCLGTEMDRYPLHIGVGEEVSRSLRSAYARALAQLAPPPPAVPPAHVRLVTREAFAQPPVLFFEGIYLNCYGHALLDNVFSLYLHLASHSLLDCPVAVIFTDPNPVTDESKLAVMQLVQAAAAASAQHWLPHPTAATRRHALRATPANETDPALRAVLAEMDESPGPPDELYRSARRSPLLRGYVDRLLARLGAARAPLEPRLVTLVMRAEGRRLLNHRELEEFLAGRGYAVETVLMTRLTLREQALQVRRGPGRG